MFRPILFVVGLTLSCVAAFYSVTGLAFVFAGAFWPVVVMGTTLEAAKVAAASWVFRYWKTASKPLVVYLSLGVVLTMLLTGIGIFGYLSRAYLIQQAPIARIHAERALIERDVIAAREVYARDDARLKELSAGQTTDSLVNKLAESNRLSGRNGALSLLRQQQELQSQARQALAYSSDNLGAMEKTAAALDADIAEASVDVGPLMFAAKAYYGNSDLTTMDRVVTVFILIILMIFDPMAIALLLAAQSEFPSRVFDPNTSETSTPIIDTPAHTRTPHEDAEWNALVTKVSDQIDREQLDELNGHPTHHDSGAHGQRSSEVFRDLSEQTMRGYETHEPTSVMEIDASTDTEDISPAELPRQLPLERPNTRGRRTRTAPKQ
jgi:hypothetical protein